ncbi:oligosaccharide flippase family protein [Pedobacter alpinus]|uniref:Oligosaccharide flippase family protein n=1 Tax=Pedobacter alpinus TaxID=1590643 RepID=A0ABW5TTR8_9SPHI
MLISELTSISRSKNLNRQIIISFFLKFFSLSLGLLIIPKTLGILGSNQYGVWLTILSIVSWLVTFDVGIGNGLRNKLAESLAIDDYESSCKYISTGYFSLTIISLFIMVIVSLIIPFVNWTVVFNTVSINNEELKKTMFVISIAVLVNFIIIIVNQIMNAFQKAAYTNFVSILHSSFFLIILLVIKDIHDLYTVTKFYSLSLVLSGLVVSFFFYRTNFNYIPKIKWIDLSKAKEILQLGGSFFIIQIATVFMFSTSSILIIQLLSSIDVSIYNVTFRLFSTLSLVFSIVVTPYWSAFTEAFKKSDFKWIKTSMVKLHVYLALTIIIAILLVISHQFILDLWLGKNKLIPGFTVALMMGVYVIILSWSNIYSHYLNGIGKLKMQTILAVIQAIMVIPLCFLFTKFLNMGLSGIMLSLIFSLLPFAIIGPIVSIKSLKSINV